MGSCSRTRTVLRVQSGAFCRVEAVGCGDGRRSNPAPFLRLASSKAVEAGVGLGRRQARLVGVWLGRTRLRLRRLELRTGDGVWANECLCTPSHSQGALLYLSRAPSRHPSYPFAPLIFTAPPIASLAHIIVSPFVLPAPDIIERLTCW